MTGDLAAIVWSAVAAGVALDDFPHDVIVRAERNGYTPEQLADEVGIVWPIKPELLEVAVHAGRARWHLQQRDRAIREAVAAGGPLRVVGQAAGLSHGAVDRIVHRSEGEGRW